MLVAMLSGCVTDNGSDSAERDQLTAEVAAMGKADLQAMEAKYKGLIAEKVKEAQANKAELKDIPLTDSLGEKATALRKDLATTTTAIAQLKDVLVVYSTALRGAE